LGPATDNSGDGAAYPVSYANPETASVAIWGGMNLGQRERIGFAIDNICVESLQEETAWGDGEDFPGKNWATYSVYNVQYSPDLSLKKQIKADDGEWRDDPIIVFEGDNVYYKFKVENTGNVGLTDISVSDTDLDLGVCTWNDLLNAGDETSCELGPFEAELGFHENEGTASAKFGTLDVSPATDTASYTAEAPPCVSPPSGLVSWWPGDGDATDIFGSNDGTLMNGASFGAGKVEQAFSFGEDQDAVRFGDVLDEVLAGPDKQFTIDLWLKINSLPDGDPGETVRADLVSKLGDSVVGPANERQLSLILRPDGWLDLAFYGALDGSSLRLVRTGETLETDVWYHIAVVYEGSVDSNDGLDRVKMYRNGTLLTITLANSTGSLGDIPDGPANLAIGGSVASNLDVGYSLDGMIDEVEIFNRALSETEIRAIYQARSGGKCKPVCPSIVSLSTNIEVLDSPPPVISVGALESDEYVRIWEEFVGPLSAALGYDLEIGRQAKLHGPSLVPMEIAAGTNICSYYVHLDNVGPSSIVTHTGYVIFDTDVLGLIISGGNIGTFANMDLMFAADDNIGYSGTTYPDDETGWPPDVDYLRGFDVNYGNNLDDAVFSGTRVDFTMWVVNAHDSFRIILPALPLAP